MNEELYSLLEEAKANGYDNKKLEELIVWYNTNKPPASYEKPRPSSVYTKYIKEPEAEEVYTPLTNLAVKAYDVVANQLPQSLSTKKTSIVSSNDFDKELIREYDLSRDYSQRYNFKNPEEFKKVIDWVGGEEIYNQRKELFEENKKFQVKRYEREADIQRQESDDLTGYMKYKSFEDAKNKGTVGAFAENISQNAGEFIGHGASSLLTFGGSGVLSEEAAAYDEMINDISRSMDMDRQDIINSDLNKRAVEYSKYVGGINAGLESIGQLVGLGAAAKPFIRQFSRGLLKSSTKPIAKESIKRLTKDGVLTAAGVASLAEGSTELLQEAVLIYNTALANDMKPSEAFDEVLNQYPRLFESFWAGSTGGAILGGGGHILSEGIVSEEKGEKLKADLTNVAKAEEKLATTKIKSENKLAEEREEVERKMAAANTIEEEALLNNVGDPQDVDVEVESIKELMLQARAEEEQAKAQKEQDKLDKEKDKLVDKSLKEQEKASINDENEINPSVDLTPSDARNIQLKANVGKNVQEKEDDSVKTPAIKKTNLKLTPIKLESGKDATKFNYETESGTADGNIVGDKASILNIFAPKDEKGDVKKGGKLYNKVVEELKNAGVKQIVVGFQSPASTGALQKLVNEGTVSVAPDSETDISNNPIRFNINEKVEEPTKVEAAKSKGEKKAQVQKKTIQEGVKVKSTEKKIKTEEGTIDLETGDVKEPQRKKLDKPAKPRISGKQLEIEGTQAKEPERTTAAPDAEKVESKQRKFEVQFQNQMRLKKPSQRKERLQKLYSSIFNQREKEGLDNDNYEDILEKVDKELQKLNSASEDKRIARVKKEEKQAKKEASKPKVSEEEKAKIAEDKKAAEKEVEALEEEKRSITDKYAAVMDKRGNTLVRAKEQSKWDPADVEKVRGINVRLEESKIKLRKAGFSEDQNEAYTNLKEQGLDDVTSIALTDPDEVYDLSPEDIGLGLKSIEDPSTASDWSNLKEITISDLRKSVENTLEPFLPITDSMLKIIDLALKDTDNKLKIFKGNVSNENKLGVALREGDDFYILLNSKSGKSKSAKRAAQHELSHIFEWAINRLDSGRYDKRGIFTESWEKMNDLYSQLLKDLENTDNKAAINLYFDTENVYGMTNPREMVAEAMSNEKFATFLALMKPSKGSKTVSTTNSYLKQIHDTLVDIVNNVIKLVNKGVKWSKYKLSNVKNLDNSYLSEILSIFDEALKDVDENGGLKVRELDGIVEAAFKPETSAEFAKPKSKNQLLSTKIFNQATKAGVKDMAGFKSYLKDIEAETGVPFTSSVKAGLVRRMNNYFKTLDVVNKADSLISQAMEADKSDSPNYINYGEQLAGIDTKGMNPKQLRQYADAVLSFFVHDNEGLNKSKTFVQNYYANKSVNEVTDKETGFKFNEFKTYLKNFSFANYTNLPTFISYISKYSKTHAPKLMKYFHDGLASNYKDTKLQVNKIIHDLNELAVKNNLSNRQFSRIYLYGQLQSSNPIKEQTYDEKFEALNEMLHLRLRAAIQGQIQGVDREFVEQEIKDLNELKEGKLTDSEMIYYKAIREILDTMEPWVKDNTEIMHGEEFIKILNYLPSVAIGSLPVKISEEGTTVTQGVNLGDDDLNQLMNPKPNYQPLVSGQSKFELLRKGGKGVYYNTNIHSVMAQYANSTLFDINASNTVQTLNKMFTGANRLKLEEEVGVDNTRRLLNYLKDAIVYAKSGAYDHDAVTQLLLDVKNKIQTAKIGTSGQFINQLVAMVPAIYTQNGVKPTTQAINLFMAAKSPAFSSKEDYSQAQENLNSLINLSSQLAIRDFWFEKYESVEDVAKAGVAGKFKRFTEKADKMTTWVMTQSDKAAATINYIAAFVDAGGDVNDPSTWTSERIAQADLKTSQLQNVSSALFVAPALRQKEGNALTNAMFWSFKSFSLNAMMNSMLALSEAKNNSEARSLAAAHAASALSYEMANTFIVRKAYGMVGLGVASVLGYSIPKDNDDPEAIYKTLVNGFYNFFFGGLPTYADVTWRYFVDAVMESVTGEEKDYIFAPKTQEAAVAKIGGPYSELGVDLFNTINLPRQYWIGKEPTDDRRDQIIGKIIVQSLYLAPIPFRGDIAKTYTSATAEVRDRERNKPKQRKQRKRFY